MPQVLTVTTDVIIYPLSATVPSCVMVHLLNWCYLHLSENHLPLNICLRSAFGKNQIRSRPSHQGHQNPSITHRCAKKKPSSAGTTILLGGPGHWPGPHQLQGRSPLGNSHFLQGPKFFSPQGSSYFCGEEVLACSPQLHPNHSIFELPEKWAYLTTSVSGYENE